ncbi:MAG: helix-turn-helix transcriptional regulator [Burkholderiales bacterium]
MTRMRQCSPNLGLAQESRRILRGRATMPYALQSASMGGWKMSKRKTRSIAGVEIHEGSGNVYADLGYPDAEEMLTKARLVRKISEIVRSKGLTQVQTAKVLGLTQPKVSALFRGRFRGISERKLIDCLTSLGRDVDPGSLRSLKPRLLL